jgi:hypothetical protein
MLFLQPVAIPEKCFLKEVLYWVAFQRLPLAACDSEGTDTHDSTENIDFKIEPLEVEWLSDDECTKLGIPPDPNAAALRDDRTTAGVEFDEYFSMDKLDEDFRRHLESERQEAARFKSEYENWKLKFTQAIEYPASKIFVALRSGQLRGFGKLLPDKDVRRALSIIDAEGLRIPDLPNVQIPDSLWSLKALDFEASALSSDRRTYCHVYCLTEEGLAYFPGDDPETIHEVKKIGNTYVIPDRQSKQLVRSNAQRGRPSYPWDGFHHEVAGLIQEGKLPFKKESGIQYFQEWFHRTRGIRPSRAAIGEKLKPYYDRFVRASDRKSTPD